MRCTATVRWLLLVMSAAIAFGEGAAEGQDMGDFDLPPERVPLWRHLDDRVPVSTADWVRVDVTDATAQVFPPACTPPVPDDGIDDDDAIQCLIDAAPDGAILFFPAGIYDLDARAFHILRSNLVLRGEAGTRFALHGVGVEYVGSDCSPGSIAICGGATQTLGPDVPWLAGTAKGADVLIVSDASGLPPGGHIELEQSLPDGDAGEERWSAGVAWRWQTRVVARDGDAITIDPPLIEDWSGTNQVVRSVERIENVGLERIELYHTDPTLGGTCSADQCSGPNLAYKWFVGVRRVAGFWMHEVDVHDAWSHFVNVGDRSLECAIRHSRFHRLHKHTNTINSQAVAIGDYASGCVVENNIYGDLGRFWMVEDSARGNVAAYNYNPDAMDAKTLPGGRDFFFHGDYPSANLVEGNDARARISMDNLWGRQGRLNTVFRNRSFSNTVDRACFDGAGTRQGGVGCIDDADCDAVPSCSGDCACWDTHLAGFVAHADAGCSIPTDTDGSCTAIAFRTNVLANALSGLYGAPRSGGEPPRFPARSFSWREAQNSSGLLWDWWVEKNLFRSGHAIDASSPIPTGNCGIEAGDKTDCPGDNAVAARAPAAWDGFQGPASLYRTTPPSWWCDPEVHAGACAFDLHGGIGAFGDDLDPARANELCALPSQIRHETGAACRFPADRVGEVTLAGVHTGSVVGSDVVSTHTDVAAVPGDVYLASISTRPRGAPLQVTGLGLDWTRVRTQCSGRDQTGVSVWRGIGTPSTSEPVDAVFAESTDAAVLTVAHYSGADLGSPIASVGSANTNGINGSCSGGTDGTAYTLPLVIDSPGAVAFVAVALRNRRHAPRPGFTVRAELHAGDGGKTAGLSIADHSPPAAGSLSVGGRFNKRVDWAVVALEIRSRSAPASGCTSDLECDDGVYCNGAEACRAGTCVAGVAVDCQDGVGCTSDACDEAERSCTSTPDDVVCDDGLYCSGAEVCDPTLGCLVAEPPCPESCDESANTCAGGEPGPIELREVRNAAAEDALTIVTGAPLQAVAGDAYIAALSSRPHVGATVAGLGLVWSELRAQCSGRGQTGVSLWIGNGEPNEATPVSATLDARADAVVLTAARVAGVDPALPVGAVSSANSNGLVGTCDGGSDTDAYAFPLEAGTADSMAIAAAALRSRAHEPGADFTEHTEVSAGTGGGTAGIALQAASVLGPESLVVDGGFDRAVDWAGVAAELRPASAPLPPAPADRGAELAQLSSGEALSSAQITTDTAVTGVAGDLYVAAITTRPAVAVSGISGLGLAWSELSTQCSGRGQTGVSLWVAQGDPYSGPVTTQLQSVAGAAVVAVGRFTGVDPAGPIGAVRRANANGPDGGCEGGYDAGTYEVALPVAADSLALGAVALRHRSHEAGVGLAERLEQSSGTGGGTAGLALLDRMSTVAETALVQGSFGGDVDWAAVALEIRPPPAGVD